MLEANSTTYYLFHSLVISLVFYYAVFVFKNWKFLKFASKENGFFLPILPFIGQVYLVLLTGQKGNVLGMMKFFKNKIGSPAALWAGLHFMYCVDTPEEIKIIFNHPDCYAKSVFYEKIKFLFRRSLFMVPYEQWKVRRRHYQKSYKPNVLKYFYPTFYKESCKLVEKIDKPNIDLCDICQQSAFYNFFYTSVGLENDEIYMQFHEMDRFGELIGLIQENLVDLILNPALPPSLWFKFHPLGQRTAKYITETEDIVKGLIKAKRGRQAEIQEDTGPTNEIVPLMDLMMDMTNEQIFDELLFFTTAATDATGLALAFTFTLLGMHPEIQEKVYNEILSTVGNGEISHENLLNLHYTEAVVWESLRLLPPGVFVGREAAADVDIGTKVIPKGTQVFVDIYHLHRDPRYWEDPLKFNPVRFLPENSSKIVPYTFLTFSAGPRDCLGKRQAIMVVKTTVASIVRKYKITSKYKSLDDIDFVSCITMRSTHPLDCHFTRRA